MDNIKENQGKIWLFRAFIATLVAVLAINIIGLLNGTDPWNLTRAPNDPPPSWTGTAERSPYISLSTERAFMSALKLNNKNVTIYYSKTNIPGLDGSYSLYGTTRVYVNAMNRYQSAAVYIYCHWEWVLMHELVHAYDYSTLGGILSEAQTNYFALLMLERLTYTTAYNELDERMSQSWWFGYSYHDLDRYGPQGRADVEQLIKKL